MTDFVLFHVEQTQNSPSMLEGVPEGGGSQSLSQILHTPLSLAARVPFPLTVEEEFFTSFLKTFHHTITHKKKAYLAIGF